MKRLTKHNYCDDTLYLDTIAQIVAFNHSLYDKLKTYIYYNNDDEIWLYKIESFEREGVNVYIPALNGECFYLPYNRYGETWALTEAELKNDK